MKRGEIYFADLNPTMGAEIKKKRPVVIVSNNANNLKASTITVVPITSNTLRVYPFEVLLTKKSSGLDKDSKAQCHQLRTIDKLRINQPSPAGTINSATMVRINAAIKLHLDL